MSERQGKRSNWKSMFRWWTDAPRWAWVFMGLCLLMPIVTLGGAVPSGIGFSGAWTAAKISSQSSWPIALRIFLCLAVTAGSWLALLMFLAWFHTLRPALIR